MQSDVVKRVAQRAGCHPAFHARVFFFTICAPQNCWIDGVFRFDPSGVLRCKHFIRGFLVVYYVECALSWINCGPRFRNTICYQKVSLKKGKTLWTSSSQLKPFLKEWMYHHIAKISFRRYIMRLETHAIFGATYSPTPPSVAVRGRVISSSSVFL